MLEFLGALFVRRVLQKREDYSEPPKGRRVVNSPVGAFERPVLSKTGKIIMVKGTSEAWDEPNDN